MRAGAAALGEALQRGGVRPQFVRAPGHDDQHGEFVGSGGEGGEPGEGLGVGPVGVVEDEHEGLAAHGEVRDDPVEAVAHTLRVGRGAVLRPGQADGGCHDAVPAAQDLAPLLLAQGGEERLDELAHHMERHLLLLLAAAGEQHRAAAVRRVAAEFAEQGGLAEPGGAREGEHPAVPHSGAVPRHTAQVVQGTADSE
ncbi:hypothetical protein GCM10023237_04680 [Streptomyces coeruleoprunus]